MGAYDLRKMGDCQWGSLAAVSGEGSRSLTLKDFQ